MSYIARTGNLTKTPELRQGDKGNYTFARIAVTDRIKSGNEYVDGPAMFYDVSINGSQAENLVETARECGNIRVTFSGHYRVEAFTPADGQTRILHKVQADDISVSLRGQKVRVQKAQPAAVAQPEAPAPVPQPNATPWADAAPAADPIDDAVGRWEDYANQQ